MLHRLTRLLIQGWEFFMLIRFLFKNLSFFFFFFSHVYDCGVFRCIKKIYNIHKIKKRKKYNKNVEYKLHQCDMYIRKNYTQEVYIYLYIYDQTNLLIERKLMLNIISIWRVNEQKNKREKICIYPMMWGFLS